MVASLPALCRGLRDYIPLKQGLRHCSPVKITLTSWPQRLYSTKTRIKTALNPFIINNL